MKNLFLVDLDDTLFNTMKFKLILQEFLNEYYEVNTEDFIEEYNQVKVENNDIYSLLYHAKKKKPTTSEEEILNNFHEYFKDPDFLFEYTEKVMNCITSSKENRVIIFTFGDENNQKLKISLHNILKSQECIVVQKPKIQFLSENLIVEKGLYKLKNYNETFEKVIYIDDHVDEGVESKDNFKVYRIEKGKLDLNHLISLINN